MRKKEKEKIVDSYQIKGINVLIIVEVNGNFIMRDIRTFMSESHFMRSYVDRRFNEDFILRSLDSFDGEKCLILTKNNVVIRCWW